MAINGSRNRVTKQKSLSLVTLELMKQGTPMALETAPSLEPSQMETGPRGPSETRVGPPPPPRRSWIWWLVIAALAAVAYWQWPRLKTFLPSGDTTSSQGSATRPSPRMAKPLCAEAIHDITPRHVLPYQANRSTFGLAESAELRPRSLVPDGHYTFNNAGATGQSRSH